MSKLLTIAEKARKHLTHGEYALLRKYLTEREETTEKQPLEPTVLPSGHILVVTEKLDDVAREVFESSYCKHLSGTCVLVEPEDAVLIKADRAYALGKDTHDALVSKGVESTFLPHPYAFIADPDKTAAKIAKILQPDTVQCPVYKSASKQIVYSVVLSPHQFDAHNDWVPAAEVEKTAHNWLKKSSVIGFNHTKFTDVGAHVVESFIERYPTQDDYQKALNNEPHTAYKLPFGDSHTYSGDWVIGIKIEDPELWDAVENGEIGAVSIGGLGKREPVDAETAIPVIDYIEL